jgi:hypothetical protein
LNLKLPEGLHWLNAITPNYEEDMTDITPGRTPLTCTLAQDELSKHMASIAELARDALRTYSRHDLVLDLRYLPEATSKVREMLRREQECCPFLAFHMYESREEMRLTIRAPEEARAAADKLFEKFITPIDTAQSAEPTSPASQEARRLQAPSKGRPSSIAMSERRTAAAEPPSLSNSPGLGRTPTVAPKPADR